MYRQKDRYVHTYIHRPMDGWMDGWMDRQLHKWERQIQEKMDIDIQKGRKDR
jgi:hypothetical protein